MSLRRLSVTVLGLLGLGVLLLMGFLAVRQGEAIEAAGWIAAGLLTLREVMSKIENVALNVRQAADTAEGEL